MTLNYWTVFSELEVKEKSRTLLKQTFITFKVDVLAGNKRPEHSFPLSLPQLKGMTYFRRILLCRERLKSDEGFLCKKSKKSKKEEAESTTGAKALKRQQKQAELLPEAMLFWSFESSHIVLVQMSPWAPNWAWPFVSLRSHQQMTNKRPNFRKRNELFMFLKNKISREKVDFVISLGALIVFFFLYFYKH